MSEESKITTNTNRTNEVAAPIIDQVVEQPKTLNFAAVSKLLNEANGSGFYDIFIPSSNETYSFKQLTVGQQRSISKNSSDFKDKFTQTKLRLAILKELCLNTNIDFTKITWPEFVYILAQIRDNNFTDELIFNVKCQEESCGAKFDYTVNFGELISNLEAIIKDAVSDNKIFEFKMGDHTVKFIMNYPTVERYLDMMNFAAKLSDEEQDDASTIFVYAYIKDIYIDDAKLDNNEFVSTQKLAEFIDTTFRFDFLKYVEFLNKEFERFVKVLDISVACPKCKTNIPFTLDLDDFFIRS